MAREPQTAGGAAVNSEHQPLRTRRWPAVLNQASHGEKWVSGLGGFLGILALVWISGSVLDRQGATMVIASMGASAVLLFAVPHGALSQPWPVLGGQLLSAFIGVTCAQQISEASLAAAAAVGLAILAMHYLRCLHPPGGATALVAVLGGESVQQLGYGFLLTPVLENALLLSAAAVLLNMPFAWRRYPLGLVRPAVEDGEEVSGELLIAHQDLVYALSRLDSFIDVSEQDLIRIFTLAQHHAHSPLPCHRQGKDCEQGSEGCLCQQVLLTQSG